MKEKLHALTIHDGLFTAIEDAERVEEIMREALDSQPVPIKQKIKVDEGPKCMEPNRADRREEGGAENALLRLFIERLPVSRNELWHTPGMKEKYLGEK